MIDHETEYMIVHIILTLITSQHKVCKPITSSQQLLLNQEVMETCQEQYQFSLDNPTIGKDWWKHIDTKTNNNLLGVIILSHKYLQRPKTIPTEIYL